MADWALEAARRATHKKIDECPHCHESWNECGVCDGTVIAVAQALREAEARGMERAAKIAYMAIGDGPQAAAKACEIEKAIHKELSGKEDNTR